MPESAPTPDALPVPAPMLRSRWLSTGWAAGAGARFRCPHRRHGGSVLRRPAVPRLRSSPPSSTWPGRPNRALLTELLAVLRW